LRQIGVSFQVQVANVPELLGSGEAPFDYVSRLALAKARALAVTSVLPVLGADTVVVCDGQVLEKPRDAEHGQAMLLQLSNRRHQVMTGVALVKSGAEIVMRSLVVTTDVFFGPITAEQARAYWQTTEPQDKAGGYAIQGLGAMFVERIEGSYSSVVGLPLYETAQLLRAFAVPIGQAR
jgi:septum formation protein